MPESSTQAEQFLAAEMKSESVAGGNFKCFKQLQSKNDSRYDALICYSTLAFHNWLVMMWWAWTRMSNAGPMRSNASVPLFPPWNDRSNLLTLASRYTRLLQSSLLWATPKTRRDRTWGNFLSLQPIRSYLPYVQNCIYIYLRIFTYLFSSMGMPWNASKYKCSKLYILKLINVALGHSYPEISPHTGQNAFLAEIISLTMLSSVGKSKIPKCWWVSCSLKHIAWEGTYLHVCKGSGVKIGVWILNASDLRWWTFCIHTQNMFKVQAGTDMINNLRYVALTVWKV